MADTLKFRGGSTNDIVSSTVSDREIIFDTEKNTLVLGSAKDYLMRYGGNSQSGNVGIGVASPSTALDVSGTVTATAFVGTGTSTAASFIPTSSTVPTNGVYLPSANNVALATNGTGRLFIDSSGNVGIGTSSPSEILTLRSTGEPKIQIEDADLTNRIGQISQAGGAMIFRSRADTNNGQFVFRGYGGGSDTDFVTISTSGNVGIGTTSPYTDALLHISKANGGGNVDLRIQNSSTTTGTTTSLKFTNTTSDYAHVSLIANRDRELIFKNTNDTVETMRIDSSGRLLVGTSSARSDLVGLSPQLQVEGTDQSTSTISAARNSNDAGGPALLLAKSRGTTAGAVTVVQDNDILGGVYFMGADDTNVEIGAQITGEVDGTPGNNDLPSRLVFSTTADGASSPTERMRIDSSGNTKFTTNINSYITIHQTSTVAGTVGLLIQAGTTNTSDITTHMIRFRRNDGTEIGKIRRGGFSAVAYDTTSDYRLKSNVVPLTGAIDRVKSFNPIRFNWIDDTSDNPTVVDGFLAHEAQTVVPEAVSGFKDEVDDEGNAVIQGIDQSKLVPLLTAALQEAIAKIETLEQRLSDAGIA